MPARERGGSLVGAEGQFRLVRGSTCQSSGLVWCWPPPNERPVYACLGPEDGTAVSTRSFPLGVCVLLTQAGRMRSIRPVWPVFSPLREGTLTVGKASLPARREDVQYYYGLWLCNFWQSRLNESKIISGFSLSLLIRAESYMDSVLISKRWMRVVVTSFCLLFPFVGHFGWPVSSSAPCGGLVVAWSSLI